VSLFDLHDKEIEKMEIILRKYIERLIEYKMDVFDIYTKVFKEQIVKLLKEIISTFKLFNSDEEFKDDLTVLAILLKINIKVGDTEYSCKNSKVTSPFNELLDLSDKTIELHKEEGLTLILFHN